MRDQSVTHIQRAFLLFLAIICCSHRALALGEPNYIETKASPGSFPLVADTVASFMADTNDWAGVIRAANDLRTDVNRVTGRSPAITDVLKDAGKNVVIIGTLGKSEFIRQLVRDKKVDVSAIEGKWESFLVQVVAKPFPGINSALVICGSDKRGTIYGIYDLSREIGVSPWYWWADVPPRHASMLVIRPTRVVSGEPKVKYRGIFINDEAPAF